MDFIELLLSSIGGAGVALLVAGWFGRTWIKSRVDKDLAVFKEDLTRKSEALKVDLAIYAHERSVGLTRIDSERATAVKEIWKALAEWQETFLSLTAPNTKLNQNQNAALDKYREWSYTAMRQADALGIAVRDRAIFFDQASYAKVAEYGRAITEVTCDLFSKTFEGVDLAAVDRATLLANVHVQRGAATTAGNENLEHLRAALVAQFRHLMASERRT
jgi:hypothetical protein